MIDIHCHILPNLDDGPGSQNEALKMAQVAEKDGIGTIIATPHCGDGVYNNEKEEIHRACVLLNNALNAKKIRVTVLPGAEIKLTPELIEAYDDGQLVTLAGSMRYLLLELPEMFIIQSVTRIIEQLRKRGVYAIIAHPERNMTILHRMDIANTLSHAGAGLQLTADSLIGKFGSEIAETAKAIVKLDGLHFIASDAHDSRSRRPVLSKALRKLKGIVGNDRAEEIVFKNPRQIIECPISVAARAGV